MAQRGSEKLLEALKANRGRILATDELEKVLDISQEDGIRLLQWWIRGQPNPDVLTGAIRVNRDIAGRVVDRLLAFDKSRFRLDVFPYGIPVPDEILIRFETPQATAHH